MGKLKFFVCNKSKGDKQVEVRFEGKYVWMVAVRDKGFNFMVSAQQVDELHEIVNGLLDVAEKMLQEGSWECKEL